MELATPSPIISQEVLVQNRAGLHLRVSMQIANCVKEYDAKVKLFKGEYGVECSIIELCTMGAAKGDKIRIEASGPQAQAVIDALIGMFNAKFNEPEDETVPY